MEFTLRAIHPSDIGSVHELQRRVEDRDRIPIATPREEFEDWLHEPHFDLARDSRLAESGGKVVAWGRIWHQPSEVREQQAYLHGAVDPALRGMGIGSGLLSWQIERAGEILRDGPPPLPRFIRVHAYDHEYAAHRLYERHGLIPIRYSEVLLRDLEALPAVTPVVGIEIVGWQPSLTEQARRARNHAFADHWGSVPRDKLAWDHVLAAFGTRLDLSYVALEGDRVVGICRNGHFPGDEAINGRRDGWIVQAGVIRSHRKRGIASALITRSLAAFKAAGFTHSALGVDSENPTGAYQLYERLGYRSIHRSVVRQMTV